MRQRRGEQPSGLVHLSILRATGSALARSARSTTKGAHQIQPAPVPMTARQTPHADMAHTRRGLSVQRMDEAPAPRFRSQVLDAISNPPDPVPSKHLDIAKPRTPESRIGHYDGPAAFGQNGLQSMQESPVGPGIVLRAHRMHFFVDRNRSSLHRHRHCEDELLVCQRAVGPIDETPDARHHPVPSSPRRQRRRLVPDAGDDCRAIGPPP